jgi:hypothetical protein
MTEQTRTLPTHAARDDKLRAIAQVFGDAVAARIGKVKPADLAGKADTNQLAWQTNRLIRHLRDRVNDEGAFSARVSAKTAAPMSAPASAPASAETRHATAAHPHHHSPIPDAQGQGRQRARLPVLVAGEDLAGEHPAVIAHVLRDEPQHIRVSVLRALPGHISRAVITRLRDK